MANTSASFADLSDTALLSEVKRLASCEREATARLIASLVELDSRRLYLGEGCSSLFTYCTQVLLLSEHAAYGRIEAARAARRFPIVLELLAEGSVTLTAVGLLAPHLTPENHRAVLDSARHRSKREVECLLATLRPLPAAPSSVRKLPSPTARDVPATQPAADAARQDPSSSPAPAVAPAPKRPTVVTPLAPAIYQIKVTVTQETYDKLRRAQDLLRHAIPNGDPAAILDRALTLLLREIEKTKLAAAERPRAARPSRPGSRHIPADVTRKVWARDGGQCGFVGTNGRCAERGFLEIHHAVPYAAGGTSEIENLSLRCKAHNAYEAEQYFGSERQPWLVRETTGPEYCTPTNSGRTELTTAIFRLKLEAVSQRLMGGVP